MRTSAFREVGGLRSQCLISRSWPSNATVAPMKAVDLHRAAAPQRSATVCWSYRHRFEPVGSHSGATRDPTIPLRLASLLLHSHTRPAGPRPCSLGMACSQLARGLAAQPGSRPTAGGGRRRLVAVTCQAVQAPSQRSTEQWRSQQSRRLLLLHAHEQRVAAKGQVAAVAPQQLTAASQLRLDGPAAQHIGAMLAQLEGDGFIGRANGAASSTSGASRSGGGSPTGQLVNGIVDGSKLVNGSSWSRSGGGGGSASPPNGRPAEVASSSARQAPQLPKP